MQAGEALELWEMLTADCNRLTRWGSLAANLELIQQAPGENK